MTYGESCSTFSCNPNYGLQCGGTGCSCPTTQGGSICDCPTSKYWTGSICTNRVGYLSSCSANYMCLYGSGLTCVGSQCICATANTYFYSPSSQCGKKIFFYILSNSLNVLLYIFKVQFKKKNFTKT